MPQSFKSRGTRSKDTAGHRVDDQGWPARAGSGSGSSPLSRGLALLHTPVPPLPLPTTHCPGLSAPVALGPTSPGRDSAVPSHHSQHAVSKQRPVGSVHWLLCCPYWPVTTPQAVGQGHAAPRDVCGVGAGKDVGLVPACLPLVRCHGHPSRGMFTPFLPWQGYQDHRLLALQLALELVPVLLGIGLSGHWLHPLGVRWRGKQVSQPSSRAVLPRTGTPTHKSHPRMLPRPPPSQGTSP